MRFSSERAGKAEGTQRRKLGVGGLLVVERRIEGEKKKPGRTVLKMERVGQDASW